PEGAPMTGRQFTAYELLEEEVAWWTASGHVPAAVASAHDPDLGETPIDPRELRNALGRFATGVCVVTGRTPDGRTAGLTVNSFSAVSLDPPLVSWCLVRKAPSMEVFSEAKHFVVHVMAQDQQALALHCAR